MLIVDGVEMPRVDSVIGLDLSLTGPGLALIEEPWGKHDPVRPIALTMDRVPRGEAQRGLILKEAAEAVGHLAAESTKRHMFRVACMEALLLQSGSGKAPERAAFWWMVRAQLELRGFEVVSVHPTSRRSIAMDDAARAEWRNAPKHQKAAAGKRAVLASVRRRWPGVVLPDDNAADALVCAEVGAHRAGFAGLPYLAGPQMKSLLNATEALGITERARDGA